MERIKIYAPVKRQLVDSLLYLLENRSSASKVIQYSFKKNKKWGSRDRRAFAEVFYFLIRNLGFFLHRFNFESFNLEQLSEEDVNKFIDLYRDEALDLDFKTNRQDFRYSVSPELLKILEEELSESREDFLKASMKPAEVYLRVNTHVTTDLDCMAALSEEGYETARLKENCLALRERQNLFLSEAFKKGFFEIQDGASQDVARFMELEPGMRVADSCAGAGGKTLHMSCLMKNKGKITAMDVFPRRLEDLKKRAKRARAQNIEIKEIQGTKTIKRMAGSFDRVLLDAPCTGTGTYRRKPESKLFFNLEEHSRLLKTQAEILSLHSQLVKPGGLLVYATCSNLPSENKNQVNAFLGSQSDFEFIEENQNFVGQNGFDGFYMAKMKRKG